jgi:hypothetical protein
MKPTELIPRIKIASPCNARWEDMQGDEHCRFCAQCQKQVYNFSAMTAAAVAEQVKAREGKLCARFYRRADGTMLTADCPVGLEKYHRRLKFLVGSALTLLFATFTVKTWSGDVEVWEKGAFAMKCESAIWTIKGWFGLNPKPVALMGDICVVPTTPANQPGTVASGNPGPPNP